MGHASVMFLVYRIIEECHSIDGKFHMADTRSHFGRVVIYSASMRGVPGSNTDAVGIFPVCTLNIGAYSSLVRIL